MRISDHFAGSYFRADDFDARGRNFTIESVEMERVGKEEKLVAHFEGEDKTLPLNKTNALEIAEFLGDDSDDWTGKRVRIYKAKTEFNGKRVPCMRVSEPLEDSDEEGSEESDSEDDAPAPQAASSKGSGKSKSSRSRSAPDEVPF